MTEATDLALVEEANRLWTSYLRSQWADGALAAASRMWTRLPAIQGACKRLVFKGPDALGSRARALLDQWDTINNAKSDLPYKMLQEILNTVLEEYYEMKEKQADE